MDVSRSEQSFARLGVAVRLRHVGGVSAPGPQWPRLVGVAFGPVVQLLFVLSVWQLFYFLRDGGSRTEAWIPWQNSLLALQFAVIHSLLLAPSMQARLKRWISSPLYGCFFCAMTCLTLLLVIHGWVASSTVLYELHGSAAIVIVSCYYLSWAALFYSLAISGLGYQTGWTPWWYWFRKHPQPRRQFEERGAYQWLRHPIYLSFLGLIWLTPRMTLDHAVLTGWWTLYILFGSYLKDERLAFYLGDTYRDYQRRVPGYPIVGLGPLGRRRQQRRD